MVDCFLAVEGGGVWACTVVFFVAVGGGGAMRAGVDTFFGRLAKFLVFLAYPSR